jgi:hypothetical protein
VRLLRVGKDLLAILNQGQNGLNQGSIFMIAIFAKDSVFLKNKCYDQFLSFINNQLGNLVNETFTSYANKPALAGLCKFDTLYLVIHPGMKFYLL